MHSGGFQEQIFTFTHFSQSLVVDQTKNSSEDKNKWDFSLGLGSQHDSFTVTHSGRAEEEEACVFQEHPDSHSFTHS